jgi:Uma2 family endonuclease
MIEVARKPEKYLLSASDVERMMEAGILPPDMRVELIHGEIIVMSPIGQPHVSAVIGLSGVLLEALGRRAVISEQNAVEVGESIPQPDIAVLEPPRARYRDRRPSAADVHLLVEISDSSLKYDHETKLPLYAEAGIPEVWIVNLKDDVLEVYRQPKGKLYGQKFVLLADESVTLAAFPDIAIKWHV